MRNKECIRIRAFEYLSLRCSTTQPISFCFRRNEALRAFSSLCLHTPPSFILIPEPYLALSRFPKLPLRPRALLNSEYLSPAQAFLPCRLRSPVFVRSPLLRGSLIKIHFSTLRQADKQGHNFNYGVKPGEIAGP